MRQRNSAVPVARNGASRKKLNAIVAQAYSPAWPEWVSHQLRSDALAHAVQTLNRVETMLTRRGMSREVAAKAVAFWLADQMDAPRREIMRAIRRRCVEQGVPISRLAAIDRRWR